MFCSNCGNQIDDNAVVCIHCGAATQNANNQPAQPASTQSNTTAIVGFVLAFFMPLIGLILSIIGVKNAAKCDGNGKGLAIAGIIISALEIVAIVIVIILFFGIFGALAAEFGSLSLLL